ncbi:ABC transporter substrate-binding protein [Mangrovactinospora gilvigrisea]|uniref:ABC transporter substrate-binding protein n=1 Tax=Mangrovactinospora gilvigrisea TaxID=1428644 RepID=A0A1J7CAI2_9ACTN|nr:ABC transporter substrate-binding protein [Mangrovactinospora gilvigrisea]
MSRRKSMALAGALLLSAGAAACSPSSGGSSSNSAKGTTTVTFRLWDDQVAKAYRQSFAQFQKANPKIHVDVQVVPWANYFTKLTSDVGGGNPPDIFWTNTSNFGIYADNHQLLDVGTPLKDEQSGWQKSVTDLYTRNGTVWGVPQLWDSIALYYNKDLVKKAGVNPADLTWDPTGKNDTFLAAAKKLTKGSGAGAQYGFNASYDGQAIYWDFAGSNGGVWQKGDRFADADPKTEQAIQYVVNLINKEKVSPPAADTNTNGNKTLQLFTQGKIALFQSGPYNLQNIRQGAKFSWGIAPMLKGPAGRVGVIHGVSALASAKTPHKAATLKVMRWLGSAQGQQAIASGGYAFPGVKADQAAFVGYWKKQGQDVSPFVAAADGTTFPAPLGPKVQAGATAMDPILQQVFLGRTPVAKGLQQAQTAGNKAIAGG